ncbi:hypothetical protein BN2476_490083 [Paraburkholderia piptadeniae]|uniref:Uncharacterized protein n=1 Tax=Paraburkholderia piptadeniae TaxID=1701573 RepID=A0A1N7SF30_9BURK|nr:hypothetical protein BN2476_490083 [Paraburkholderia piptadeniae]
MRTNRFPSWRRRRGSGYARRRSDKPFLLSFNSWFNPSLRERISCLADAHSERDAEYQAVREHFSDAEIVELT